MRRIILSCLAFTSCAAFAGNMTLTIDQLSPIAVSSFAAVALNPALPTTGGGAGSGKVEFKEFIFKATQSAATPSLMLAVSDGRHFQGARLQVRTTDGARLLSEWQLSEVLVSLVRVESGDVDPKSKNGDIFLAPETKFALDFRKVCYKVFAADGTTVASQMCWDQKTNSGI